MDTASRCHLPHVRVCTPAEDFKVCEDDWSYSILCTVREEEVTGILGASRRRFMPNGGLV